MEKILFQAMIGAIVGLLLGLVPLIAGAKRGKQALGIAGFFACTVSAGLLGIILAGPICAVFARLILRKPASPPAI